MEETIRYIDALHQKLLARVHTDGLPARLTHQAASGKRRFRGGPLFTPSTQTAPESISLYYEDPRLESGIGQNAQVHLCLTLKRDERLQFEFYALKVRSERCVRQTVNL